MLTKKERYKIENRKYNNVEIKYIPDIEYWCITDAAKACNKKVNDYWRLKNTEEFLNAYSKHTGIPEGTKNDKFEGLISRFNDHSEYHGTWAHKNIFIDFAQWASLEFRIIANEWITQIYEGNTVNRNGVIETAPTNKYEEYKLLYESLVRTHPNKDVRLLEALAMIHIYPEREYLYKDVLTEEITPVSKLTSKKIINCTLNPKEISEVLVKKNCLRYSSARKVNNLLKALDLQYKDKNRRYRWHPTKKAINANLCTLVPYKKVYPNVKTTGSPIIRWESKIIDYILNNVI